MKPFSLLALCVVLLAVLFVEAASDEGAATAAVGKPADPTAVIKPKKNRAAGKAGKARRSSKNGRRRRPGTKRHPEESEEDSFESIGGNGGNGGHGGNGGGEGGILLEETPKECPRLSVAKEKCTAFGKEVCAAHPNVFQTAPKLYHSCLRNYCGGFERRCQILETIATACGLEDSHSKLMEHGCDRVWKPAAGKQKRGKQNKLANRKARG